MERELERIEERIRSLRRDYEMAVSLMAHAANETARRERALKTLKEINGKIDLLSASIEQSVLKEYGRRIKVSA